MTTSEKCMTVSTRTRTHWDWPPTWLSQRPWAYREGFERGAGEAHLQTKGTQRLHGGGLKSGVNGTPTFFINGRRHDAAYDFDYLVAAIDAELTQAETSD